MAARLALNAADARWDRTCGDCVKWVHDDGDGGTGDLMGRPGRPLPRVGPPPCYKCPKVPAAVRADAQRAGREVTPADADDPGPRHRRVVAHYLECVAVMRFPDDGWVRRHAGLIARVKEAADRRPLELLMTAVARLTR